MYLLAELYFKSATDYRSTLPLQHIVSAKCFVLGALFKLSTCEADFLSL